MIVPPSIFLLDERVFVNLGILKVTAVLEQSGNHVEMLDLSGIENYLEVLELHIKNTTAKTFAITVTTPQLPAVSKIAERIRNVRPDVKIVAGGPHITLVHAATKLEKRAGRVDRAHRALTQLENMFDVLVSGDGEMAIFEALKSDAPKLIDGDDNRGPLFMNNAFYNSTPWPARHLIDMSSYNYSIEGHKATSLIAQLGCPYKCTFCGGRNSKALRVIRTRTSENIVHEIEHLHKTYGYTGFMMYDDELNVNKGMVELMNSIADLQLKLNTEFRLRGFVKAELFTDEQAEAMKRAGFRWILCGFEAAHPRILENIEKQATIDDNTRVIEIAKRHELKVKALMSIGHAGESKETVQAVHDWLLDAKPDDFDCTVITTYPGCPYYDEAVPNIEKPGVYTFTSKKTGDRLHSIDVDYTEVAEYYKGDPNGGYHSYVFTDHLLANELVKMRDWVETSVRKNLHIPFNQSKTALRYEHSMGQGLPPFIFKKTV